jgi:hypothetical protein
MENNITQIRKAVEHWVSMVQNPDRKCRKYGKSVRKVGRKSIKEMRNIDFPEFGPPRISRFM